MNRDESFERRLQSQPLKPAPPAWRAEILAAAQVAATPSHGSIPAPRVAWWRELFWPHPAAWAALAGLWLVMLGARLAAPVESPERFARQSSPSPQMRELLQEQVQLFAELTDAKANRDADRPKAVAPQPHSARREDYAHA